MPITVQINMPPMPQAQVNQLIQSMALAGRRMGKHHMNAEAMLEDARCKIRAVSCNENEANHLIALCQATELQLWCLNWVYEDLLRGKTFDEIRYKLWQNKIYLVDELTADEPEETFFK